MKVKCAHAFKANKSEENREKTNELLGVGGPDITPPVTSFGCLEDFKLSDNKLFLRPPRQVFFYILLYSTLSGVTPKILHISSSLVTG